MESNFLNGDIPAEGLPIHSRSCVKQWYSDKLLGVFVKHYTLEYGNKSNETYVIYRINYELRIVYCKSY